MTVRGMVTESGHVTCTRMTHTYINVTIESNENVFRLEIPICAVKEMEVFKTQDYLGRVKPRLTLTDQWKDKDNDRVVFTCKHTDCRCTCHNHAIKDNN